MTRKRFGTKRIPNAAVSCFMLVAPFSESVADVSRTTQWDDAIVCFFEEEPQFDAPFTIMLFARNDDGEVIWTQDEDQPGKIALLASDESTVELTLRGDDGHQVLVSAYFHNIDNKNELGIGLLSKHIFHRNGAKVDLRWQVQTGSCSQRGKGLV